MSKMMSKAKSVDARRRECRWISELSSARDPKFPNLTPADSSELKSDQTIIPAQRLYIATMAVTSLQALKRVKDVLKAIKDARAFDHSCLDKMNVISANADGCVCEMTVEERHLNVMGTLHGGCTATLVDIVSTMAAAVPPPHIFGVSVDLSVSFLRGAKLGEEILIEAKNVKIGKTLAFLEVAIKRKSDGKLVATGKHTKFITRTDKSNL